MVRILSILLALVCLGAAEPQALLIRGAHVFDGTGTPAAPADVLVQGDRIVAVGPGLRAPRGARVIDGRGMTLLPGLHDLHTHLRSPGTANPEDLGKAYAEHLLHGITTTVDFSVSGEMLQPIRAMTGADGNVRSGNLELAIRIGVPGGHGTERGWGDFFTMEATTPRAANLVMDRALAYRPDVVKVFADGWRYGRSPDINSMDLPTLRTIVERAHAAGIPVITHTVTLEGARIAAGAGVDALGHGVGDAPVDDALIALMRQNDVGYVPTMAVYEPQQARVLLPAELARLAPPAREREAARRAEPVPDLVARRWTFLRDNLRRLRAAGVRVGIGTDAGIGGVYQGSAAIREIRLLTDNGFSPAEALAAATSVSAAILRDGEARGRIAPGQRADLVLVGGRPDRQIEALYDVRRVIVRGREVALPPLRALVDDPAWSPLPTEILAGPIDTGARGDGRTDLDTLPFTTYESGTDHSHPLEVRPGTAPGRRLLVAEMGSAPQPFAELDLPLTRGPVYLADARAFAGVVLEARGPGRYALILDGYGSDEAFRADFTAGETAREVRLPFAAFRGSRGGTLDLARLRTLIVRIEGAPATTAWLEFGNLRFYR